jgi:hypothetical protein
VSTYRTNVRVDDGTLYTARPLTAPEKVADMIDSLIYQVTEVASVGGDVLTVDLTIETAQDSGTPIGDGVVGTSSAPLPGGRRAEDDVDPGDGTPYLTEPASLADDDGELDQPAPGPAVAGQQ